MPRGQHPNSLAALAASRKHYPPPPARNGRRLVHGAYRTPGAYAELLSERFFAVLAEGSPLAEDETFVALVAVVSGSLERLANVKAYVDANIDDQDAPRVQRALDREERLRREVLNGLERLRMAPASREDELAALIADMRRELVDTQGAAPHVVIEYVDVEAVKHRGDQA